MAKRPRSEEFRRRIGRAMDRYPTVGVTTVDPSTINPPDAVGELLASAASLKTKEELRRLADQVQLLLDAQRAKITKRMEEAVEDDDHPRIKVLELAGKEMSRAHADRRRVLADLLASAESYQQQQEKVEAPVHKRKFIVVGLDGTERDI